MENKFKLPSPEIQIEHPVFQRKSIEVFIKRDDQIHAVVSGNKWRKLKYNLEKCHQEKYDGILTFGGAYSNHLRATARAGKMFDVRTIGVIRGEELKEDSNPTLKACADDGMQLVFTPREEYALRDEKYYHEELRRRHGNFLVVSEGGANFHGLLGCVEIIRELEQTYDHIFLAGGTGTTASGLLYSGVESIIHLVPALKGGNFLSDNIVTLLLKAGLSQEECWSILDKLIVHPDYHFGGYARFTEELIDFMNDFHAQTNIPLDQVYTGKAAYGMMDQIQNGGVKEGERVLFLHTGGLQGTGTVSSLLNFV